MFSHILAGTVEPREAALWRGVECKSEMRLDLVLDFCRSREELLTRLFIRLGVNRKLNRGYFLHNREITEMHYLLLVVKGSQYSCCMFNATTLVLDNGPTAWSILSRTPSVNPILFKIPSTLTCQGCEWFFSPSTK